MDVARIKTQKDDPFSKVEYLTENAARAILAAPDVSTAKGRRDQTMLTVLYDTGARISELLELHLSDLRLSTTTPTATLLGKGGVVRHGSSGKRNRVHAVQVPGGVSPG